MTRSSVGSLGLCCGREHGLGQQRGRADRRETAIEEEANMMATRLAAGELCEPHFPQLMMLESDYFGGSAST